MSRLVVVVFFIFLITNSYAQVKVDAEIRPRFEYRHGFKTLFPNNAESASFVSQRSRLNAGYTSKKLNTYISLQNIRIWGDVPQLNINDSNGLAVHQAWGEIEIDSSFALKIGRQEIAYDDQRILGSVGWAQQARSHDAAIIKYAKSKFKVNVGFAYNQSKAGLTGHTLITPKTYKSLQYLWMHQDWKTLSLSFLFLNNGLQFIDEADASKNETRYSQTVGTHLKSKGQLSFVSNLYYQFGKDKANNDLSAYLVSLEANYKATDNIKLALGGELQSGNKNGVLVANKNIAFTPLYGTNHKFNGFMDYFYVGNHANSVGLFDAYIKANAKLNKVSALTFFIHNFSSAANISDTVSRQLGTEIDLVYGYKVSKEVALKFGYSQLFASQGMHVIKSNTDNNINNWGWAMVVIKPTLFNN